MLTVAVLGPVEVRRDGDVISVPSGKTAEAVALAVILMLVFPLRGKRRGSRKLLPRDSLCFQRTA